MFFKIAQYIVISPGSVDGDGAPVMKLESILILTCLSGLQCTVVVLRCHCNPAALVAQLVEHWPRNLVVVGLSPIQDSSNVSFSSTVCCGCTALLSTL